MGQFHIAKARGMAGGAGLLLLLTLLVAGAAHAQGQAADSGPMLHVEARQVVVDVTVTDSKGNPIRGLTKNDFRVLEDGAEQKVLAFEERSLDTAQEVKLPQLPANTFANLPMAGDAAPLNVILYDLLSTAPEYQHYAHEQLVEFLKSRPPGRYAVFVLGNDLRLVQGFTAERELLLAAASARSLGTAPSFVDAPGTDIHAASSAMGQDIDPRNSLALEAVSRLAEVENEERDFRQDLQVQLTLDAFTEIAQFLMPLPGRKNLLWLSGSFPLSVLPNPDDADPFNSVRNYSAAQKKVADLLNLSHTAVYAVDVRGLLVNPAMSASARPNLQYSGGGNSIYNNKPGPSNPSARLQQNFSNRLAAEQASLSNIAVETGGRAFFNTNGLKEAFAKAVDQGSHYYMLAYHPSNENFDGKLRKIRVEVGRNGYQLAYRRSYFADDEAGVAAGVDSLAVAMRVGTPAVEDLPFISQVAAGKAQPATPEQLAQLGKIQGVASVKPADVAHYQVDIGLVTRMLTRIAGAGGVSNLELEFAAYAYGPDGRLLNAIRTQVRRAISADKLPELEKSGYHTRLALDVPAGAQFLRLGVRDDQSNRVGALELRLPLSPEAAPAQ
jgi:VWFA-related protein